MAIIDSFSPLANFWEKHPQLIIYKAIKGLHNSDDSTNKEQSSKVMWAIGLVYDYESEYALEELKDRIKLVEADYLETPDFFEANETFLQPVIDDYMHLQQDALRRALCEEEEALDKRTKFLRETPWTIQNGSKIDKMRSDTKKQLDNLVQMKREYLTKKLESNIKGGHKPSLKERGLL